MRLDLRLQYSKLCIRFLQLLSFHLIEQFVNLIHLAVKPLLQQEQLIIALFIHPCIQIAALHFSHESDNDPNSSGNPVHEKHVKEHSR
ncbi:hypothetical protein D3C73_1334020 [compost metagenome]